MKKLILTFALSVALVTFAKAEFFITSFGVELGWNIPHRVQTVVYHDFYGYDIIHANRFNRHGRGFFDLVLQRGNTFIELRVRRDGFITRSLVSYNYPLFNHVCGLNCGYHSFYYSTYFNHCNSIHHHGHNHVVYNVRRPYIGHRHFNHRHRVYTRLRQERVHTAHRRSSRETRNSRINSNQRSNDNTTSVYNRRTRVHDSDKARVNRSDRNVNTRSRSVNTDSNSNSRSTASRNSSERSRNSHDSNRSSSRSRETKKAPDGAFLVIL